MRKNGLIALALILIFVSLPVHGRETLKVGVLADTPPISFVRPNSNQLRGISVDIAVLLFKIMRVDPVFRAENAESLVRALSDGSIDVAFVLSGDSGFQDKFATIDVGLQVKRRIFVNKSCKTITCLKDIQDRGEKVVLVQGDSYAQQLQGEDSVEIIYAESPVKALELIEAGRHLVYIAQSETAVRYIIQQREFSQIAMAGLPIEEIPLVFAVRHSDSELIKRLGIAYGKISETGNMQLIQDKWLGQTIDQRNFAEYFKYFIWSVLLLMSSLVLIGFWNFMLKRKVQRAVQDLQTSEHRYRDLIESSPDMIFLVTPDGGILHANERARMKLAFPADENELNLRDLVLEGSAFEVTEFLKKVFSGGWNKYEFTLQLAGDENIEVEIAGRPIKGALQNDSQACLFARDVTKRNRMEEELIQSERLATIGKMAASVAHEINNPLGIILANADELMCEPDASSLQKEGLEAIQRSATRAGKITHGLLDLASPQSFEEQLLDVEAIVDECLTLLKPKLKKTGFETKFPEGGMQVLGDRRGLQQVIVNLLLNSIYYMDDAGHITVTGTVESTIARIVVADSGEGIPAEHLGRIFEPFFTSRKSGFGLGLFVSRRIIEKHGGCIYAESEPCTGTRMVIELRALENKRKSHV